MHSDGLALARHVIAAEAQALTELAAHLDDSLSRALELVAACDGCLIVTGLGKSGHVGRRLAATLSSTGTISTFIHATEALHGDSGMLTTRDILMAISNSGATEEVVAFARIAVERSIPVIAVTNDSTSPLADVADVVLLLHVSAEADPANVVPSASLAACAALGDALAIGLMQRRGQGTSDFARCHPGGSLGRRLGRGPR